MGNYYKYCNIDSRNGLLVKTDILKSVETFQPKREVFDRRGNKIVESSEFMIDYIAATHNLFQIQQKRIDELEKVVTELNAKI